MLHTMDVRRWLAGFAMVATLGFAMPAAAQFSDSYNFLKAVKDKDVGKAREIVEKPGNTIINTRDPDTGGTALHIATRRSDAPWVGFLLQENADTNSRDRDGNTPLIVAAQARWSEGVRIFLSIKARVDEQNRLGETALQTAVQNRDSYVTKMLIDAGASPDMNDNSGKSARSLADGDPRNAAIAKLFKDVPVRKPKPVQGPSL